MPSRPAWAPRRSASCSPKIPIVELAEQLREDMRRTTSEAKRKKLAKRLKVVESFRDSGNRPSG
jgi:DNA-directed RNA polymerase beta' subunit